MTDYDSDKELHNNDDIFNQIESDSFVCSVTLNSSNTTPINNIDDYSSMSSYHNHRHNHTCYTVTVFVVAVGSTLKKRIKNSSPSNISADRKYLNLSSIDDGFQEDNPSPVMSSTSSDRDQSAMSDVSEGFYCLYEQNHLCPDEGCINVKSFLINLKSDFPLPNKETCNALPKFNDKFYNSLEQTIQCFEDKFASDSSDWLRSNVIQMNQMEVNQACSELKKILESIFSEKINWGRIIAMIGFVCELSHSAFIIGRPDLIKLYIMASVEFVDENLWDWISFHGGWEGLMDFQSGQSSTNTDLENIFSGLTRIARVAALALAGVALCKYVADRI